MESALAPSAPLPPPVLSDEEFQELLKALKRGNDELPTPAQLREFRVLTSNRLLFVHQLRTLAATVAGGKHFFREVYERQLLADPYNLAPEDGFGAVDAFAHQPQALQANQAFMVSVSVLCFDGRVAELALDPVSTDGHGLVEMVARRLDMQFDHSHHYCLCIGTLQQPQLGIGTYVRVTALTQNEQLNGMVGPIVGVCAEGDGYHVVLPVGTYVMHQDNLLLFSEASSRRHLSISLRMDVSLADNGVGSGTRILWLERQTKIRPSHHIVAGQGKRALCALAWQFQAMNMGTEARVSAGEFRNFLWNLRLNDADFNKVRSRFIPEGHYIRWDDLTFLLGRPHLLCPSVPVDALIYEAVVSILGRRTTAHIDRDLSGPDEGVGYAKACKEHCASYTVSIILQVVVWTCLVFLLLCTVDGDFGMSTGDQDLIQNVMIAAGVCYCLYLFHLCCGVRLTSAFRNQTRGMENVIELMDKPRYENPVFHWRVQCYHYRTVHYTEKDSQGRSVSKTRQERVNTHSAHNSGVIPSQDHTPTFAPQTQAQQTQINTDLNLDFSSSNYLGEYQRWCLFHRWDVHQDCSRSEDLPSRASSCMALWVPRTVPWWFNEQFYWLANLFMLSFVYRFIAQSRIGSQRYTYHKKCFNINETTPSGGLAVAGAVLAGAGIAASLLGAR
eukprot:TRINITY_DN22042_c0_g1_i1.p1 TRINITY_DN22042_c0_g1~~TRINITY_DN22042_c0_g1_i1.p1  ORF type:complete len:719 (+),score=98.49 TRINITY_DN22042_c0_g1_i1:146-2158(+)